jgi:hypothetical protein
VALKISPGSAGRGEGCVLALLPEEPAGKISTRNAGAVSFGATLSWYPGDGVPAGPILGNPVPGARFYSLLQTDDASATRRVSCEIRALHAEGLARALDAALRSVTTHATLTEATLETCIVRIANPTAAYAAFVEELARQLWGANLPVSFGTSWTPVPGAEVSVGIRGLEEAFETFLSEHSAWQAHPRSR